MWQILRKIFNYVIINSKQAQIPGDSYGEGSEGFCHGKKEPQGIHSVRRLHIFGQYGIPGGTNDMADADIIIPVTGMYKFGKRHILYHLYSYNSGLCRFPCNGKIISYFGSYKYIS